MGGISDGVKCLLMFHVDFCLLFVQVFTNDGNLLLLKDKITELLNITERQKKIQYKLLATLYTDNKENESLKSVNYRKTYFAIWVSFVVYFKIGLISIFKDKNFSPPLSFRISPN